MKCYKCRETGHFASQCQKAPKMTVTCYRCNIQGHRANECPQQEPTGRRETKSAPFSSTSTNVVQPAASIEQRSPNAMQRTTTEDVRQTTGAEVPTPPKPPYMIPVNFGISDGCGNRCTYSLSAMIDSGSPISLIKANFVPVNACVPLTGNLQNYSGLNNSPLKVLSIFQRDVEVQGIRVNVKFHVVPDDTMSYVALLGRDFTTLPYLNISMGKTFEISKVDEFSNDDINSEINQIMHIECYDEANIFDELQINPEIGKVVTEQIRDAFKTNYLDNLKLTKLEPDFEMVIAVNHNQPISSRPRRLSFSDIEALRLILDDLLKRGVIRESASPYASPIVLARKKTGEIRLCVDFRELNKITVGDNFPCQLIDDNLDSLKNKKYFTSLDLRDGFFHVKMSESSVPLTSFVTPLGQYEYLRMPFGLKNAPRVFQRFIQTVFATLLRQRKILMFLDDAFIATETLEEHLNILSEVFEIAGRHHLQFRLDKCRFAQTEIDYLGYRVNENGVRPSDANVKSVLDYPVPRNTQEVHRFVCLASYFRRFIPSFSTIAKPLYDLTKKDAKFKFGAEENYAFETLKSLLSSKPVLAIYSPTSDTELHCDASASGYGAILIQKQNDGTLKPVYYFSQRTTPTESRYHSFELECLAVIYALKRFHIYLSGLKFKVITDCDSFRLTLSKKNVNPRISRWALFLQDYDFEIVHRPGTRMAHVDALSRCHSVLVLEANTFDQTLSICQDRDEKIRKIRDDLGKTKMKFFELRDGLVYRKDNNKKLLFYVPESMEQNVIRTAHDDLGHLGLGKVFGTLIKTYWFPRMREKIGEYIANCLRCIEFSPSSGKKEGYLHSISKANVPFDTVHVDHYGPLSKTGRGFKHIFIIVDAFTKHIRLYPCKSTATREVLNHFKDYFRIYGRPRRIISDRGTAFTSDAFEDFVTSEKIDHVLIAVGTPRANGQVERFNRVIAPMLAKLCETPEKWDRVIDQAEFSLNNTICRSTGDTPSRLLFGVDQRGKVNDCLRLILESNATIERNLSEIRKDASIAIEKNQLVNKKSYDKKRKDPNVYKVGDYVMIRNVETCAGVNKKLIPKFKGPYEVETVLDCDRYIVSDIDGFQVTQRPYTGTVAPDQMRPYITDKNGTSPSA